MHDALIACRFLHFGAVVLLFGIVFFRSVLFATPLRAFEAGPARRTVDTALTWLAALALISAVAWLMITAASLADGWGEAIDPQTLALVLGNTFFGHVWIVHLALGALAFGISLRARTLPPMLPALINALLLLTLAPVGHGAMFDGVRGLLLIVNQMLHLIGVATWLGGLAMLALLLSARCEVDMSAILRRFSGIGYVLVALIIVTGLINVRALSGALWPEPAFSGFGLVLAVKTALVLCMLALAGLNRQLSRAAELRLPRLRASVVLECLFGAAALGAVSLLGTLPPMLA
ncbi:copper homeostasis membrane protein CopD [Pseudomonas sp. NFR16]|uniref:copper homeostasis membrane protein CopD n=1 Tax=Pseudomonas sp. NFR16 TaxID=1566248 RepID=UPI0008B50BF3|nr:copper homeostasis membrane protein CopD [Pseudomonas sp. NFR16]SEI61685.1 putative copper resistance protein D [Pseudomonas sp. NFR16]